MRRLGCLALTLAGLALAAGCGETRSNASMPPAMNRQRPNNQLSPAVQSWETGRRPDPFSS